MLNDFSGDWYDVIALVRIISVDILFICMLYGVLLT